MLHTLSEQDVHIEYGPESSWGETTWKDYELWQILGSIKAGNTLIIPVNKLSKEVPVLCLSLGDNTRHVQKETKLFK